MTDFLFTLYFLIFLQYPETTGVAKTTTENPTYSNKFKLLTIFFSKMFIFLLISDFQKTSSM